MDFLRARRDEYNLILLMIIWKYGPYSNLVIFIIWNARRGHQNDNEVGIERSNMFRHEETLALKQHHIAE